MFDSSLRKFLSSAELSVAGLKAEEQRAIASIVDDVKKDMCTCTVELGKVLSGLKRKKTKCEASEASTAQLLAKAQAFN
eukprot:9469883-Alexandrium_andersonii.AAC.1